MSDQDNLASQATDSETKDATQAGASDPQLGSLQTEPETVESEPSGPDYRGRVGRNDYDPRRQMSLYRKDERVYFKKARGLEGPLVISKAYTDGTYRLETESGQLYKDGAKERDLQPL
ncbi:hypothetical protein MMC30_006703 [Trapelia coarctata]|nr:hypothetical protein [Trapelia coarctata]